MPTDHTPPIPTNKPFTALVTRSGARYADLAAEIGGYRCLWRGSTH